MTICLPNTYICNKCSISTTVSNLGDSTMGFGADDNFDTFLAVQEPPVPQSTPARIGRGESVDSDDNENDFNVFIK